MDVSPFYITSLVALWVAFVTHVAWPLIKLEQAHFDRLLYNELRSFFRKMQRFFIVFMSVVGFSNFIDIQDDTPIRVAQAITNILTSACLLWAARLNVAHIGLLQIDKALEDARTMHQ